MIRRLFSFSGGRNLVNEDLEALQNQHLHNALIYSGYGNIVVSGCRVTPNGGNYNISSGVIYFDNGGTPILVRFAGAINVDLSSPKWIVLTNTNVVNRFFSLLNSTGPGLIESTLSVSGTNTGSSIAITTSGLAQYFTHIPRGPVGSYLHGDFNDALFDVTGLGIGILTGWALCNGNNGTSNLNERYLRGTTGTVGVDAGTATHRHQIGKWDVDSSQQIFIGQDAPHPSAKVTLDSPTIYLKDDSTTTYGYRPPSILATSGTFPSDGNFPIYDSVESNLDPHRTTKIIRRIY